MLDYKFRLSWAWQNGPAFRVPHQLVTQAGLPAAPGIMGWMLRCSCLKGPGTCCPSCRLCRPYPCPSCCTGAQTVSRSRRLRARPRWFWQSTRRTSRPRSSCGLPHPEPRQRISVGDHDTRVERRTSSGEMGFWLVLRSSSIVFWS